MLELQLEERPSESKQAALPMVLHVRVVTGAGGGPEKTILNSPRFLPELGYQSVCAYMRPANDSGFQVLRERARHWQAPLVEIDDHGAFDRSVVRRLLDVCREYNVAVWHGHDYKSNLIGVWLKRHWPMQLVTTLHGWVKHTWKTPLYYALDRFSLRWYERVICVSEDLYEAALRSGLPRERCVLIHNAIATDEFQRRADTSEAKHRLGFRLDRPLVGAVGRLSAEKGFDVLLEALARLVRLGRQVDLAIIGEGDEMPALRRLVLERGLLDHVHLLGYRSDIIALYEAFDAFALSSYREGLPNVLLEAMAMEVPVVATSIAGVPALLSQGRDGLLVPPGDPAALAAELDRVLFDPSSRNRLIASAKEAIESRFTFARRMEKVARVYDELLQPEHHS
jgi:glycosyltransferase involved in cell wall biosynthesis